MPTPTIVVPFGESSEESGIFAVVEFDSIQNVDQYGNELSEFIDTEQVSILLHTEPGAITKDVTTSYGDIVNENTAKTVTRTYSKDEIVFKGVDDEITLSHYPSSNVELKWKGREREITIIGRKLKCKEGAGICSISYKYQAKQYILEATNLDLARGEDFPVEVSFEVVK